MLLDDATRLIDELVSEHLDSGWSWSFDSARYRFGCCIQGFGVNRLQFSSVLIELNDVEAVRDVILHEIAHGLAPRGSHHNWLWVQQCRKIGARPERCYSMKEVVTPKAKYSGVCPHCNGSISRMRKPRSTPACTDCCQKYNNGRYSSEYMFKWSVNY
jgi:hypothetical protein